MSMNIEQLKMPVKNVPENEKVQTSVNIAPKLQNSSTGIDASINSNGVNNNRKFQSPGMVGTKDSDGDGKSSDKGRQLSRETLDSAFASINNKLKMQRTRCEYDYDETINRVSIKVYDKDTDELVLETPPEESLEALRRTLELAGIIVDKKY